MNYLGSSKVGIDFDWFTITVVEFHLEVNRG